MLDQPLIKVLLLVAIVGITVVLTRSTVGARHQAVRRLMLAGFFVVAVLAILFPGLLTRVAQALGVGRGADLLLYGLVVFFFGYVASAYRRSRQTDLQITTLARELALREALDRHAGGEDR